MPQLDRKDTELKKTSAFAADHLRDLQSVTRTLASAPSIVREYLAPREEFAERVARVNAALQRAGHSAGFVFSDERYRGDVPTWAATRISPSSRLPV